MPDRVDSRRGPGPRRPVQPGHDPLAGAARAGAGRRGGRVRRGVGVRPPGRRHRCAATRCSRPSPCSARWRRRRRRSSWARWSPTCNHRTPALLAVAAATLEAIAERQVHLGLGAGAAPDSRWSAEMRAIGQPVAATVAERHARVEATLDVFDTMFDPGRDDTLATFPLPRRRPTVLLGVNGPTLAAAGRAARRRRQRRLGPPATRRAVRRRPRRTGGAAGLPADDVDPLGTRAARSGSSDAPGDGRPRPGRPRRPGARGPRRPRRAPAGVNPRAAVRARLDPSPARSWA